MMDLHRFVRRGVERVRRAFRNGTIDDNRQRPISELEVVDGPKEIHPSLVVDGPCLSIEFAWSRLSPQLPPGASLDGDVIQYEGGKGYVYLPSVVCAVTQFFANNRNEIVSIGFKGTIDGPLSAELFIILWKDEKKVGLHSVPLERYRTFRLDGGFDQISIAVRIIGSGRLSDATASIRALPAVKAVSRAQLRRTGNLPEAEAGTLRVAAIVDPFTENCLRGQCTLLQFGCNDWQTTLEVTSPDLLFVESAWEGNRARWGGMQKDPSVLRQLVRWCQSKQIPTVFWNKEDPIHFDAWIDVAGLFDWVFTVDADTIDTYRRRLGSDRVSQLLFASNPTIHNPIELPGGRIDKCVFPGSYYGAKFPERANDMRRVLAIAQKRGLDIFDRNYGTNRQEFHYPEEFQSCVVGTLPPEEIFRAYKGYRVLLNFNSVKTSRTMVARRIFEVAACGTPILSNYSPAVARVFGDSVLASDDADEIREHLDRLFDDDSYWEDVRLRSLRTVLREHTYAHRLGDVSSKVGLAWEQHEPRILCVGVIDRVEDRQAIEQQFRRQIYPRKQLVYMQMADIGSEAAVREIVSTNDPMHTHLCFVDSGFSYPDHYLEDLAMGIVYSGADIACIGAEGAGGSPFSFVTTAEWRRSIFERDVLLHGDRLGASLVSDQFVVGALLQGKRIFQVGGDGAGPASRSEEAIKLRTNPSASVEADSAEAVNDASFAFGAFSSDDGWWSEVEDMSVENRGDKLIVAKGSSSPHAYLRFGERHGFETPPRTFPLPSTGTSSLEVDFRFRVLSGNLEAEFWGLAYDARERLGHLVARPGARTYLPPIEGADRMTFAVRLAGTGTGEMSIEGREYPTSGMETFLENIGVDQLCEGRPYLVLTNAYPHEDDIYRNAFVHSRVRRYQREGLPVLVYALAPETNAPLGFYRYDGVPVLRGGDDPLRRILERFEFAKALVHFLDERMYEALSASAPALDVLVWVHGIETERWYRRWFNLNHEAPEFLSQLESHIGSGNRRAEFMAEMYRRSGQGMDFVFVSDWFRREVAEPDAGVILRRYAVIPNFVDDSIFEYSEKNPADRFRILSIRPFSSRKYANDLTAEAICLLADESWFKELKITIVGKGHLFEETVAPLRRFKNVELMNCFISQEEIAELHKSHGVFLCPTRLDAQGVSMCEAMSSGLVPVTSNLTAIPEFVDPQCGFLTEPENSRQIADSVRTLYADPSLFQKMSRFASSHIRSLCSYDAVMQKEIALITR